MAQRERETRSGLGTDTQGQVIQAVPLVEGKCNLDSGEHFTSGIIHCAADGDILCTWSSGNTPTTIACKAGEDYAYFGKVTIQSGLFHLC